jgi:hypothetical protein
MKSGTVRNTTELLSEHAAVFRTVLQVLQCFLNLERLTSHGANTLELAQGLRKA